MANEAKTDRWVNRLLEDAGIDLEPQKSSIKEIDDALKTASKKKNGRVGKPDFIGVVKDYLIVIEDKEDIHKHEKLDENGILSDDIDALVNYAMNGAVHYAKHLATNTSYKKVFGIGVAGNEKMHKITPFFITDTMPNPIILDNVETFISFNENNIDELYTREVLQEDTDTEKETAEILKDAAQLHEDLRNYGNLQTQEKPLIVSGILLALSEIEHKSFEIDSLTGDTVKTDGEKIYEAIENALKRAKVDPVIKRDKVLHQFLLIKNNVKINEINPVLGETPLKYYTKFLYDNIYKSVKYTKSSEDYLGRFYGEFMSYGGGDGQTLGIVLTPKHITELFCELIKLKSDDVVLDPCCGTAGFLIAAMHNMINSVIETKGLKTRKEIDEDTDIQHIRQAQLGGFELQPYMFTIATTNMILRGDGKSNILNTDFLDQDANKLQIAVTKDKKGNEYPATVGMINPPYSQGSKKNPHLYEINFIKHLLDSLSVGARCVAIVPQSTMTGKSKDEQAIKDDIFQHHTLEGVITLNHETFYGVGVHPVIAIFTAHEKHPANKECKFINFENDGYKVAPHIGLLETDSAKDKKQHLLDVWFDKVETDTKFCVKSTVKSTDEWLHSFYYFNDEIPTDSDFDKTIGDYLSFEFSMIMQGREYLFKEDDEDVKTD